MKRISCFFLALLPFSLSPLLFAQETENIGALWTEVGVTKALPYNLSIDASIEHRTLDWFDESSRFNTGLGINWKATKHWKLGMGYTFILKHSPREVTYKQSLEREYNYEYTDDALVTHKYEETVEDVTDFSALDNYLNTTKETYTDAAGNLYAFQGYDDKVKNDTRTTKPLWRAKHRLYFDVAYTHKLWKTLRISLRERYQVTFVPKKTYTRTRYREKTVTKHRERTDEDWDDVNDFYNITKTYWQEGDIIYESVTDKNYTGDDETDDITTGPTDVTATYLADHEALNTTEDQVREKSQNTIHILRSRLKLSIDRKGLDWEPYVSVETHNNLGHKWNLDKIRATVGVEYKINRHHTVGGGYVFNHENDDDGNYNIHAIALSYNYKF